MPPLLFALKSLSEKGAALCAIRRLDLLQRPGDLLEHRRGRHRLPPKENA
jgi:hypothetical protein